MFRVQTLHGNIFGAACLVVLSAFTLSGCGEQPGQQSVNATDNTAGSTSNATTDTANTTGNTTANSASGTTVAGDTPGKAVAVLHPTKGSNVRGTVTFTKEADGVRIVANITGLKPGAHGFHAHQNGDCSAPDASSAGGHFNPTNEPHSSPESETRHVGDFGNLTADGSGRAQYSKLNTKLSLEGLNSVVGRAIIVHAKADDLKTQPTGDAGGREACGVVGIASAE